jgi:hypothetical protein
MWAGVLDVTRLLLTVAFGLSGYPRLSGRFLISDCLPFPLAGRPFHRSHPANSTLYKRITAKRTGGRVVSAP